MVLSGIDDRPTIPSTNASNNITAVECIIGSVRHARSASQFMLLQAFFKPKIDLAERDDWAVVVPPRRASAEYPIQSTLKSTSQR
jgi:hypothetical protein